MNVLLRTTGLRDFSSLFLSPSMVVKHVTSALSLPRSVFLLLHLRYVTLNPLGFSFLSYKKRIIIGATYVDAVEIK